MPDDLAGSRGDQLVHLRLVDGLRLQGVDASGWKWWLRISSRNFLHMADTWCPLYVQIQGFWIVDSLFYRCWQWLMVSCVLCLVCHIRSISNMHTLISSSWFTLLWLIDNEWLQLYAERAGHRDADRSNPVHRLPEETRPETQRRREILIPGGGNHFWMFYITVCSRSVSLPKYIQV